MYVVLNTAPNREEAERLAREMVEAKLAACVQVLPGMRSFYFWEAEVRDEPEHLLLIKVPKENFARLEKFIQTRHSYDVPEIVALEAADVAESYLNWLRDYAA